MALDNVKVYRKKLCPYGQHAVDLLRKKGIAFEDHLFADTNEEQAFKINHQVQTTPQIFIDGERIGGYSDLANKLQVAPQNAKKSSSSYWPVITVFAVCLLMAIATQTELRGFMGFSLCVLACLKIMDLTAFIKGFVQYDLLAKKLPVYAKVYPLVELLVGLSLLAKQLPIVFGAMALVVGFIGAVSIIKSVYIDKLNLNCACVGGNSKVPLGFLSLTENLAMIFMGTIMLL
ncbi:glutaredoxin [Catenovulum agarivorans DS-2]|uniref:Methylamine utilization protein MauE n=1 Tax=Catenovulum agarivorans DS-2 TaxID=1328313 RepID=W7QL50_9ALTE|nr:MauE/DoxX family redox-associated membrane protein [Catenovulum agarivorans]EWH09647.1 glutaredoxin [Catenovulum agarivorans DS-2]